MHERDKRAERLRENAMALIIISYALICSDDKRERIETKKRADGDLRNTDTTEHRASTDQHRKTSLCGTVEEEVVGGGDLYRHMSDTSDLHNR